MNFDDAFEKVIGFEGGYVNNPKDPGGETTYGVTKVVAMRHGYLGNMRQLPLAKAKAIYKADYWDAVKGDVIPEILKYPVFDAAVNSGVGSSIRWLQRALGVKDDGIFGPVTLAKIQKSDPEKTLRGILSQRLTSLTNLPTWDTFGRGWARRLCKILEES